MNETPQARRRVGVVALARPTFDVPLAEATAASAWSALEGAGVELAGGPSCSSTPRKRGAPSSRCAEPISISCS